MWSWDSGGLVSDPKAVICRRVIAQGVCVRLCELGGGGEVGLDVDVCVVVGYREGCDILNWNNLQDEKQQLTYEDLG